MTTSDVSAVEAIHFGLCVLTGLVFAVLWLAPFID